MKAFVVAIAALTLVMQLQTESIQKFSIENAVYYASHVAEKRPDELRIK